MHPSNPLLSKLTYQSLYSFKNEPKHKHNKTDSGITSGLNTARRIFTCQTLKNSNNFSNYQTKTLGSRFNSQVSSPRVKKTQQYKYQFGPFKNASFSYQNPDWFLACLSRRDKQLTQQASQVRQLSPQKSPPKNSEYTLALLEKYRVQKFPIQRQRLHGDATQREQQTQKTIPFQPENRFQRRHIQIQQNIQYINKLNRTHKINCTHKTNDFEVVGLGIKLPSKNKLSPQRNFKLSVPQSPKIEHHRSKTQHQGFKQEQSVFKPSQWFLKETDPDLVAPIWDAFS